MTDNTVYSSVILDYKELTPVTSLSRHIMDNRCHAAHVFATIIECDGQFCVASV